MKKYCFPVVKLTRNTKIALLALAVLILVSVFFSAPTKNAIAAAAVKRDLPIYCVQKNTNVVSLTFDAA